MKIRIPFLTRLLEIKEEQLELEEDNNFCLLEIREVVKVIKENLLKLNMKNE